MPARDVLVASYMPDDLQDQFVKMVERAGLNRDSAVGWRVFCTAMTEDARLTRLAVLLTASTICGLFLFGNAAHAEVHPSNYQRVRAAADTVLVMEIADVLYPAKAFSVAQCKVSGRVTAVERGANYVPGDELSVSMPCVGELWQPIPGPFAGYSAAKLSRAKRGRLYLREGELVARGYDELPPERKTQGADCRAQHDAAK